jgi:acylphosphatase
MKARAHIFIRGRVQGVFFRSETKVNADRHGVRGWVRNLPDGSLEAVFEGEEEAVKALVEFCKRGPQGAKVLDLDVTWGEYAGKFEDFEIK